MKISMTRLQLVLLLMLTASLPALGQEYQWRAYNDCIRDPVDGTAANVTEYSIYSGSIVPAAGKLKDFDTGQDTDIDVTFTLNTIVPVLIHADYVDYPSVVNPVQQFGEYVLPIKDIE